MEEEFEIFTDGDMKHYGINGLTATKTGDENIILHLPAGTLFSFSSRGKIELLKSSLIEENSRIATFKIKDKKLLESLDKLQSEVTKALLKNSQSLFKKKMTLKDVNNILDSFYDVEKEEITFEIYTDDTTTYPTFINGGMIDEETNAINFADKYPVGSTFNPVIILRYLQYESKDKCYKPILELFQLYSFDGEKRERVQLVDESKDQKEHKKEEKPETKKEEKPELIIENQKKEENKEETEEDDTGSSSSSSSSSGSSDSEESEGHSEESDSEEYEKQKREYELKLRELEAEKERFKLLQMEKEEKLRKEKEKQRKEKEKEKEKDKKSKKSSKKN